SIGRAAAELLALTGWPAHLDRLIPGRVTQPEVQARVALRQIARSAEHVAVQPPAAHLHTNACAQGIDVRPSDAPYHQPVAARCHVLQDRGCFAHVPDDDLERAAVVEIADSGPARRSDLAEPGTRPR